MIGGHAVTPDQLEFIDLSFPISLSPLRMIVLAGAEEGRLFAFTRPFDSMVIFYDTFLKLINYLKIVHFFFKGVDTFLHYFILYYYLRKYDQFYLRQYKKVISNTIICQFNQQVWYSHNEHY